MAVNALGAKSNILTSNADGMVNAIVSIPFFYNRYGGWTMDNEGELWCCDEIPMKNHQLIMSPTHNDFFFLLSSDMKSTTQRENLMTLFEKKLPNGLETV